MSEHDRDDGDGNGDGAERSRQDLADRIVGGVSIVLVVAVLVASVWTAFARPDGPTRFSIRTSAARESSTGYHVAVDVRNDGYRGLENVTVRGELRDGDTTVEEAEFDVDWLASGEEGNGTLVFTEDPADYELDVAVVSYRP